VDLSRELDYSEYRTEQIEATMNGTARSRMRLYGLMQEAE